MALLSWNARPPLGSAWLVGPILTVAVSWIAPIAFADDADIDPSFGWGFFSSGPDRGYAVALQPDGKIVVVGERDNGSDLDMMVLRSLEDGSQDTSFSGDGKAFMDFGWGHDSARDVALTPDGSIVVAGSAYVVDHYEFGLVWFSSTGVMTNYETIGFSGGSALAAGVAVQLDGKVVVVGQADNASDWDFALARLLSDGTLDSTFSTDGKVRFDFGAGDDAARDLAIHANGEIAVSGTATALGRTHVAVARFTGAGVLGMWGLQDFGVSWEGRKMALQRDNKIVVAAGRSDGRDAEALRFLTDGTRDTAFLGCGNGIWDHETFSAIALQNDGKKVLVGSVYWGEPYPYYDALTVYRFNAWGGPDNDIFDSDSPSTHYTKILYPPNSYYGQDIAIDPQGRMVIVGYATYDSGAAYSTFVIRLLGNETQIFVDGFESAGTMTWSASLP